MESVVAFSENIRSLFELKKDYIDLPFFYSFPKNTCESAACFHGLLIREKFPDMRVEVVHGYNREEDENHYWVEVEGTIFDLTCDQFEGISDPIYAASVHPLSTYFPPIKRFSVVNFVINYLETVADVDLFSKNKKNIRCWLEINV